jgi:tRNA (guanine-N7-)-methyltransferase
MGQKKLIRFEEIKHFPNVLHFPPAGGPPLAGHEPFRWDHHFGNNHPLVLELACGKGDYTLALARRFANKNFIGVDLKGNRIWKGARTALDEQLTNVAFLRSRIEGIDRCFAPGSVAEIWITFPDPYLRKSKAKKRLTHLRFLHLYQRILAAGSTIHLKTDSDELYAFTRETLRENHCSILRDVFDIYASAPEEVLRIQTFYEKMHLQEGRTIHYLAFTLPAQLPPLPEKIQPDARATTR